MCAVTKKAGLGLEGRAKASSGETQQGKSGSRFTSCGVGCGILSPGSQRPASHGTHTPRPAARAATSRLEARNSVPTACAVALECTQPEQLFILPKTVSDGANLFVRLFGDTEIPSSGCTETNQCWFQHFKRLQFFFNVAAELCSVSLSRQGTRSAPVHRGKRPQAPGQPPPLLGHAARDKSFLMLKWKLLEFFSLWSLLLVLSRGTTLLAPSFELLP